MFQTNQFRKGLKIEIEGVPFQIVEFQHVSPGKGSAFTRTKLKNMLTMNVVEKTFKSGEKVHKADLIEKEMQYLYADGDGYHFMDTNSYEQLAFSAEELGDTVLFLKEEIKVSVLCHNDKPIGVDLPNFVELAVAETDPAHKGDTVTGGTKPAKLESGATVSVPFHISEGDVIKVDTRENKYVEKVKK